MRPGASFDSGVRALLSQGDRRTIGHVDRVVAMVLAGSGSLPALLHCLFDVDAAVRMRAADALEKISRQKAGLLQPYSTLLLGLLEETEQQELLWHLAVLMPRLRLTTAQRSRTVAALYRCLEAKSSIARTFALQGMAELAKLDATLVPALMNLLQSAERTGTAAMKARSRKLLKELTLRRQARGRNPNA